jgi:DNA-binding MarR family transcriptional regulator
MATAHHEPVVPTDILDSLQAIMYGAVGMTTVALARASAGELTLSQWRALVVIGRNDGVHVGDISAAVGMSLPSTSRLVRRLERRGLVSTARDEADRRATLVRMTAAGRRLRNRVVDRRRDLMDAALAANVRRLPKNLSTGLAVIARALEAYE